MMLWLMLFWCVHLAAADEDVEKQCLNDVSSYFLCGNICMYGTSICTCGNDRLYSASDKYCCIPPGYNCTGDGQYGKTTAAECPNGKIVHKSKPCHGVCPDHSDYVLSDEHGSHISCGYPDMCEYDEVLSDLKDYKCGDLCPNRRFAPTCICGNVRLSSWSMDEYCCIAPEENCNWSYMSSWQGGSWGTIENPECDTGKVVKISERCNGLCYNSYFHSSRIGPDSHYSCPDGRCIKVDENALEQLQDRCRGVEVPGVCGLSTRECDNQLSCRPDEATKLSIGDHHYCSYKSTKPFKTTASMRMWQGQMKTFWIARVHQH